MYKDWSQCADTGQIYICALNLSWTITMSYWTQIYAAFANSVDPDQLASKKPTDLHLHCLSFSTVDSHYLDLAYLN